jgi:hypothetical protein
VTQVVRFPSWLFKEDDHVQRSRLVDLPQNTRMSWNFPTSNIETLSWILIMLSSFISLSPDTPLLPSTDLACEFV